MTNNKKLRQSLLSLGVVGMAMFTLILTGCGQEAATESESDTADGNEVVQNVGITELGESMPLAAVDFNPNEVFASSDAGVITNQEAFDLLLGHQDAIVLLMNLVDEVLLRGNFEIDPENTIGFWEEFKATLDDVDEWMINSGFATEDDVIAVLELQELRTASVRNLFEVTDEEIGEIVDEFFADAEDQDEAWGTVYRGLVQERASAVMFDELARLRHESGFAIFNDDLSEIYAEFFLPIGMTMSEIDAADFADDVIVVVNDVEITTGQFFNLLSRELGFSIIANEMDDLIIRNQFTVTQAEVEAEIQTYRDEFGDEFYEILENAGFDDIADFFEVVESMLLQRVALAEFTPQPSEAELRVIYDNISPQISGSHILVDDYDFALELIAQLSDASDSDFEELFAELAASYSECPSGERGGDLGSWARGQMVSEFDDAIFALAIGDYTTEPVQTQFGYHIILKTGLDEIPAFEDIRDDLLADELIRIQNTPGVIEGILFQMRKNANLEFSNPVLQAMFEAMYN